MTVNFDAAAVAAAARRAAGQAIVRGTESVRNEAVRLVMSPPKTGVIYKRRGVEHQASAPGEAPANDTGRLVNSIRTDYDLPQLVGRVVASTEYAAYLEYGTENMEPRPYMRPALANRRAAVVRDVEDSIAEAVRAARRAGGAP